METLHNHRGHAEGMETLHNQRGHAKGWQHYIITGADGVTALHSHRGIWVTSRARGEGMWALPLDQD